MKAFKKILSAVLAASMALALMVGGASAETVNYTITAPSNGHTYEVYQVFTGDLSGSTLSNIKAGADYKGTDAKADAEALAASTATTDAAKLAAITPLVNLDGTPAYTVASGASVDVPAGYYLIKDIDSSIAATANDSYTLYLAKIVGNTTIEPKTSVPTVEKKVQDVNDSTGVTTGWQDSADYDIGDTIPFQITATMGDLSAYQTYYVKVTDTMTHLTYVDGSAVVTVDGTVKTGSFTTNWDATNKVLTVTCNDVKAVGAGSNSVIVVTYNATLDTDANIGSIGNSNTVNLTYSNNPNNSGNGSGAPSDTGKTPDDTNIVFTYKVIANKVANSLDGAALVGASFKLEKINPETKAVVKDYGTITGTNVSEFAWNGIDDGTYVLTETVTPAGYNTIAPQTFTVEAAHVAEAETPTLTSLSATAATGSEVTFATGAVTIDNKTSDNATLTTKVVNKSGAVLPTTGGMGTTMFYVAGGILVAAAGILLITKKRMAH